MYWPQVSSIWLYSWAQILVTNRIILPEANLYVNFSNFKVPRTSVGLIEWKNRSCTRKTERDRTENFFFFKTSRIPFPNAAVISQHPTLEEADIFT